MTIEEKRDFLSNYCSGFSYNECSENMANCKLIGKWEQEVKIGDKPCLDIHDASEEELDKAIALINNTTVNAVDHPSHYNQGGIECIDAMVSAFGKEAVENFCLCNAFKYVWRNRDKNGFEDIDKAIWYLNKIKELISNG